ncbi:MAG: glycosyltransferase, partial [Candidatus Thermoplasmatota archaeon]|nr:glycosyltransferase [Candidatus Thermoplasmatota archaeon]
MTASTAIITSFDDGLSLRRLLDSVIQSNVDQIVLMYGGERTDRDYLNALQDDRLIYEEEKERLGKSESLNRSFKYALGDLVFIVSGDISVENNVFDRCADAFSDDIGVIVPHVIPAPMGGIHGKIGRVLWKLHDCELHYMSARNINAHGGEFVAIRKKLLSDLP